MGRLRNFIGLDFCLPQDDIKTSKKKISGKNPELEEIDFDKQPFVVCSKANDIIDVNRSDIFKNDNSKLYKKCYYIPFFHKIS